MAGDENNWDFSIGLGQLGLKWPGSCTRQWSCATRRHKTLEAWQTMNCSAGRPSACS